MIKILLIFLMVSPICPYFIEGKQSSLEYCKRYETGVYLLPSGQRFGDRLLEYVKAKWIAYKTGLPLYISPCRYYHHLALMEKERILPRIPRKGITKVFVDDFPIFLERVPNTFYIVRYYPILDSDKLCEIKKERKFISLLQETISSTLDLEILEVPDDKITLALHVRKGTGVDSPIKSVQIFDKNKISTKTLTVSKGHFADFIHPLKFPPEQYYIDQIKKISEYFHHKPIYLFVFTDDPYPPVILERIKEQVGLKNITYDCFPYVGRSSSELLRDFFSMMNFDCLIRPGESNYSTVAELLSTHKLVIYPKSYHFEKDDEDNYYLMMDQIQFIEQAF